LFSLPDKLARHFRAASALAELIENRTVSLFLRILHKLFFCNVLNYKCLLGIGRLHFCRTTVIAEIGPISQNRSASRRKGNGETPEVCEEVIQPVVFHELTASAGNEARLKNGIAA